MSKSSKNKVKQQKNQEKNKNKIKENEEENEIEIEENEDKNSELNEAEEEEPDRFTPSMEREVGIVPESVDVMYDIKDQLEKSGISLSNDVRFLISKKDANTGKYAHVKTFVGEVPELDTIGALVGGGDFLLKIYAAGGYKSAKTFSISMEAYPKPSEKVISPNGQPQTVINQASNNTGLELMLSKTMEQNTALLIKIMEVGNKKENSLSDTIEMLTGLMKLQPKTQEIPYAEVLKMSGEMFKAGMTLKERIEDTDKDEDISDVLIGVVKDFASGLPAMLSNLSSANQVINENKAGNKVPVRTIEAKGTPSTTPSGEKSIPEKPAMSLQEAQRIIFQTTRDFLDEIIVAYESELEVNPYIHAEKAYRISRFKVIGTIVKANTDDKIIAELVKQGAKKYFDDEEFTKYFLKVIDIIRNYDKITLDDDGEIVKAAEPEEIKEEIKLEEISQSIGALKNDDNVVPDGETKTE